MPEEEKDQLESKSTETVEDEEQAEEQETPEPEEKDSEADNGLTKRRGRLITAVVIAVVVLSFVVVIITGIVQYLERGAAKGSEYQGTNDPAPMLWNDMVGKKDVPTPLGVPKSAGKQFYLKERSTEAK